MYKIEIYVDKKAKTYIKKIDKEIWELRPLRDRILFASLYNNKFMHIYQNATKDSKREIRKAKKFLEDYKKEVINNEKI